MAKTKVKQKRKKESFMQGVLALMISQVLIKLLGLVYKLYITNKEGFGDQGNAIYNAGFSIYALLLTISSIGVPSAISKIVSERLSIGDTKGAHKVFKIALATFAIIGLVGTGILFFGAHYIANLWLLMPEAEMTLVALSPSIFFVSIISVIRGYFNGRETLKATANSQTVEQLFKTVATILIVEFVGIVWGANTKIMAAGANLATTVATFAGLAYLYLFYRIRRKEIAEEIQMSGTFEEKSAFSIVKEVLSISFPVSLSSILTMCNRNIDSVTVMRGLEKITTSENALAQYGILSGKVDTLTTLPLSFNIAFATALVPAISAAKAKGDMKTGEKRTSFSLLATMLIGLPCMVGMIIFAQQILNLLFPNANQGAFILQVSSLAIIFTVLEQTISGALQGLGKYLVPALALTVGVIAKFILNIVLVPIAGIEVAGAAFATAVCHMIAFGIEFYVLKKNMNLKLPFSKFILKPVVAVTIMGILSYGAFIVTNLFLAEKIATLIGIFIAVITYAISIISLKIFTKEEMFMIPYGQKLFDLLNKFGLYKEA